MYTMSRDEAIEAARRFLIALFGDEAAEISCRLRRNDNLDGPWPTLAELGERPFSSQELHDFVMTAMGRWNQEQRNPRNTGYREDLDDE